MNRVSQTLGLELQTLALLSACSRGEHQIHVPALPKTWCNLGASHFLSMSSDHFNDPMGTKRFLTWLHGPQAWRGQGTCLPWAGLQEGQSQGTEDLDLFGIGC